MKTSIFKEVQRFIAWLIDHKHRTEQPIIDQDYYAIGMYAFYLAEVSERDG